MNSLTMSSSRAMTSPAAADTLQTRFALRVAARLSERSHDLEPELGERLRAAREQALERARAARTAEAAPALTGVPSRLGAFGWYNRADLIENLFSAGVALFSWITSTRSTLLKYFEFAKARMNSAIV